MQVSLAGATAQTIQISNNAKDANVVVGNVSETYLIAPGGTQSKVNNMVFGSWSNLSDFLDAIIDCVEPASGNSMSLYSNGSGFSCTLKMVNTSGSATSMTFQFRE